MNQRIRLVLRPPALLGGARATERMVEVEAAQGEVRLGRGPDLDLTLPFPTVSTLHARVFALDEQWWVEDLGSVNGTWIGPRRIGAHRPEPLRGGDELRLADITVVFAGVVGDGPAPPVGTGEVHGTTTIARRLVADLFGAVRPTEVAVVEVVEGPDRGQRLPLPDSGRVYRVGRGATCDLVLSDADASREHVALERRWDGIFVTDLGSKNGVMVEGKRIAGAVRLGDGTLVVLGATRLRLDDPEDRYLRVMQDPSGPENPVAAPPAAPTPEAGTPRAVAGKGSAARPARQPSRAAGHPPAGRTQRLPQPRARGVALWFGLLAGGVLLALAGLVLVLAM